MQSACNKNWFGQLDLVETTTIDYGNKRKKSNAIGLKQHRVDIWRDRCDRRSRKFLCELRKYLGKQREMLYNFTPKLRNFTDFA